MTMICCPGCGCNHDVPASALTGQDSDSLDLLCDRCADEYAGACGYDEYYDEFDREYDDMYADYMDGDFDSAMRDAGHGMDEDYGYYDEPVDYYEY